MACKWIQFFNKILGPTKQYKTAFGLSYSRFHTCASLQCFKLLEVSPKDVALKTRVFVSIDKKDKQTFINIIKSYQEGEKTKRGHVEFIYAALKCMQEFDVHTDVECYKALMDVFPKGKMIPKNLIQAEFQYFPRHQDCALELLDKMEDHAVCSDMEMKDIVRTVFGESSMVFKKLCYQMYWMPKFKNLNPYQLPTPIPSDVEVLAELALRKMSVDLQTKISHFKAEDLEDAVDHTWIVSAQSPLQQKILEKHNAEKPLYVEGSFIVWMSALPVSYFILRADPVQKPQVKVDRDDVKNISLLMFGDPKPKDVTIRRNIVHEQEDATIFAMCATGTSSKDSALSWIRFLRQSNPLLDKIPVLFTLKSPPISLVPLNASKMTPEEGQSTEGTENLEQKT